MKLVWEEEDIVIGERVKYRNKKEVFIIGFMPFKKVDYEARYTYISLNDGQIMSDGLTKKELAKVFTEDEIIPHMLLDMT